MPFTVTADDVFDRFKQTIRTTRQAVSDRLLESVDRPELRNFYQFVEANTDANYRNVENDRFWKALYGVRPKQFDKFDSKTETMSTVMQDASYCQRCGIILPLRNLTIDPEAAARGQCRGDVTRFQSSRIDSINRSWSKEPVSPRAGSDRKISRGNQNVLARGQKGSDADRYTLNNKGKIYFTMLQHYNLTGEMLQMSMHHIVNLRPMCGPCNSGLRNINLTWI